MKIGPQSMPLLCPEGGSALGLPHPIRDGQLAIQVEQAVNMVLEATDFDRLGIQLSGDSAQDPVHFIAEFKISEKR